MNKQSEAATIAAGVYGIPKFGFMAGTLLNNSTPRPLRMRSPFRPTDKLCENDTAPTGHLSGGAERRKMDRKGIMLVLEQERDKHNMTLQEWASHLNIPLSSYSGWIYGYREPGIERLIQLLDNAGYELTVRRKK